MCLLHLMVHYLQWLYFKKLRMLATDPFGQLYVLGHDSHTLGMQSTQVGVLEYPNQVSLTGLLQGHDGVALEPYIHHELRGHFPHKALEWQLPDQKLRALLIPPNLLQRHGAWPVTMGPFEHMMTDHRRCLACCRRCKRSLGSLQQ